MNYHPINLKIDRILTLTVITLLQLQKPILSFCIHATRLVSRESCKLGNFYACLDVHFYGAWHMNMLDIHTVDRIPDDIQLAVRMRAFMQVALPTQDHT